MLRSAIIFDPHYWTEIDQSEGWNFAHREEPAMWNSNGCRWHLYTPVKGQAMALGRPPPFLIAQFGDLWPHHEAPWPTPVTHHALLHGTIIDISSLWLFACILQSLSKRHGPQKTHTRKYQFEFFYFVCTTLTLKWYCVCGDFLSHHKSYLPVPHRHNNVCSSTVIWVKLAVMPICHHSYRFTQNRGEMKGGVK